MRPLLSSSHLHFYLHFVPLTFRFIPAFPRVTVLHSLATWAEDRATVGTDPSADPGAVYRCGRVAFERRPSAGSFGYSTNAINPPICLSSYPETRSGHTNHLEAHTFCQEAQRLGLVRSTADKPVFCWDVACWRFAGSRRAVRSLDNLLSVRPAEEPDHPMLFALGAMREAMPSQPISPTVPSGIPGAFTVARTSLGRSQHMEIS